LFGIVLFCEVLFDNLNIYSVKCFPVFLFSFENGLKITILGRKLQASKELIIGPAEKHPPSGGVIGRIPLKVMFPLECLDPPLQAAWPFKSVL
jgi:hypothetical protein